MTALILSLISNPTILGIGAAIVAVISALFYGRVSGAKAERNAQKAKEADAYEQHLEAISKASSARNSVDSRLPDSDPYRRD